MALLFKQKCIRCRERYVLVGRRDRFPVCYECHKSEMQGEITDPEMKKLFDIDEAFYERNMFLRNIKIAYLKFGSLSEKQIAAFTKTVDKMKKESEKTEK